MNLWGQPLQTSGKMSTGEIKKKTDKISSNYFSITQLMKTTKTEKQRESTSSDKKAGGLGKRVKTRERESVRLLEHLL